MSHPADIRFHRVLVAKLEVWREELRFMIANGGAATMEDYRAMSARHMALEDVIQECGEIEDELKGIHKGDESVRNRSDFS